MASPEYHAEEIAEVSFLKSNLFWLCWVLVAVHGLSLVVESGGYSWLWCAGFSPRWRFLLQSTGSRLEAVARGPSNCRQASLLRGMWNLPRAGLEPLSPVLTGGSVHCTTREAPCRFDNSWENLTVTQILSFTRSGPGQRNLRFQSTLRRSY